MLAHIRRFQKGIAFSLLLIFTSNNPLWALTSGPSQPETQQFAPTGMDNMVDPFTGDFSYNIPLMDVGGYPININYAAGITPDQEASWVGLGWNLNVGAINRTVRGIADDFKGDFVQTEHSSRPNETFGVSVGVASGELFTSKLVSITGQKNYFYNTYNGFGMSTSLSPSLDIPLLAKSGDSEFKLGFVPSLALSIGSEDGVGITPSFGLKATSREGAQGSTLNTRLGFPFSSREGAKGMSFSNSFSVTEYRSEDSKYEKTSESIGTSGFKGFATPTYTTNVPHNTYSVNATLNLSLEDVGLVYDGPTTTVTAYYNGQHLVSKTNSNPSYGFLYEGINSDDNVLNDFNREKDNGYNDKTTNMPVTNHTYDIFSVSGEGVGGTYRVFRNDVSTVGDVTNRETGISPELGVSGGYDPADPQTAGSMFEAKLGVDFKYIQSNTKAGRFSVNHIQNAVNPRVLNKSNEVAYFGKIGEAAPENEPAYLANTLQGYSPYEYEMRSGYLTGYYQNASGQSGTLKKQGQPDYLRTKRKSRTSSFTYLTAEQAKDFALAPISSYTKNNFNVTSTPAVRREQAIQYSKTDIDRYEGARKPHHLSEIRVTGDGGSRYVYGIPVYNNFQHDVTFSVNVSDKNTATTTGKVPYSSSEASINNSSGLEQYYDKTKVPGSASSYLLTYILSSDYVDSDNIQGPSDGDLGTYVKFNYSRTSSSYKWRTPYEAGMANFAEGLQGKSEDDKGSYSYGEKELWYVHSIETPTHVAEFHISARKDGIGVENERGGKPSMILESDRLQRLDSICLYSKPDKLNGFNEKLKTVHLEYDYSLCPGIPNSEDNSGKLTLKKVYFTYGNSYKGVLNPYVFKYDSQYNFPYNSKNYDRWGIYKNQNNNFNQITNEAYPYTLQDKALTDKFAAAYCLTKINTPTGGEMDIHYESDDYGYVQDRQAMQMFRIVGVSSSLNTTSTTTQLYDNDLDERKYLHIDLGEGFSGNEADPASYVKEKYLKDLEHLQYRINVEILDNNDRYEYLTGYCEFKNDASQIHVYKSGSGNYDRAVITLEPEPLNKGSRDIHPFVKSAWLFGNQNYKREMMGSANATTSLKTIATSILSSVNNIIQFTMGFRNYMKGAGNGKYINSDKSFVRLYDHDKTKLGGGHRVKAIIMLDKWSTMLSDRESGSSLASKESAGYGQVYDYTMPEDPMNASSVRISSGVSAYEPIIGGEENPWRELVKTSDRVPIAPDKEYYTEKPFGESFFPTPTVGYSKVRTIPVKVTSENYVLASLQSNGTGYVEQEFYTAKDFPTIVNVTDLDPYRMKSNQFNPLKFFSHDYVFCSQGYYIELNDMHGKPKSTKVMPDSESDEVEPISYVRYEYKTDPSDSRRLNNNVPLVSRDLQITATPGKDVGVSVDVVNDTRFSESITAGGGVDFNVDISGTQVVFIPFIPIITPFPDINYDETKFQSITTTKVVNRYGILLKTIAQENGQVITTENLAWDDQTGAVLLTKVVNEFHDPLYSFTYPAHWGYQNMGFASQNEGLEFTNISSIRSALVDGDEILCRTASGNMLGYYDQEVDNIIDKEGAVISSITWAKVIRSGARNMASIPIANVSCRKNPVVNGTLNFEQAQVLNAGATEFKYVWKGFCNCGEQSEDPVNPFVVGKRGQLRAYRSWTYLTDRTQNLTNGEANIRQDGYFTDFQNFWVNGTSGTYLIPFHSGLTPVQQQAFKWQFVSEITNYNNVGMEIENKDALGRYSMAQYGYGRKLPTATSNNSRYQESGFDGFEDYDYGDCNDDHFSWRVRKNDSGYGLSETESHTGKKSFKVPAKGASKINKVISVCPNN